MSYTLHWNGATFSGVIVERMDWPLAAPARDAGVDLTGRDGGFAGTMFYGKREINVPIVISGQAQTSPAATARENYLARVDALLRGLNTRTAGELYFDAQTDRYWLARFAGADALTKISPWTGRTLLRFVADDPFAYATAESTDEIVVTADQQAFELESGGSAESWPAFVVTPGGGGAGLIVVENELRGERLAYGQALAAGKELRIDCSRQVVEISDTGQGEWSASMLHVDGVFPALAPGTNSMVIYGADGATLNVAWRDRYL